MRILQKGILSLLLFAGLSASSLFAEKYALIFGTNYKGDSPISDLELCERDAEKMKQQIVKTGSFEQDNVKVFLGAQVTRKAMEENIVDWLGKKVKKDDQVFFYFAGHGQYFRDAEAKNGMRNYIIMFNRPHVSDDELSDWFSHVNTTKSVIIFDACFSGGIAKKGAAVRGAGNVPIPEGADSVILENNEDVYFQNKVVIGSADDNETAIELSSPINHGVFTYYFSEALLKGDLNNDGNVTAYEAFYKARKQTSETAAKVKHKQTPQISGDASGFYFVGGAAPAVVKVEEPKLPPVKVEITKEEEEKDPPISVEEPVNEENTAIGHLLLKTTYRKDVMSGSNPEIYIDSEKAKYRLSWKKDSDWGEVAEMKITGISTGVHNVTIKAKNYPDKVIKTGIEKNDTTVENIAIARSGRGSIEGHIWVENFDRPAPNLMVFLKPIRIPKQPHVRTDDEGHFVFSELKPGKYTVFVRGGVGVFTKPYDQTITITEDEVTKIDIVLREYFKK